MVYGAGTCISSMVYRPLLSDIIWYRYWSTMTKYYGATFYYGAATCISSSMVYRATVSIGGTAAPLCSSPASQLSALELQQNALLCDVLLGDILQHSVISSTATAISNNPDEPSEGLLVRSLPID